jgi:hypothetical protein
MGKNWNAYRLLMGKPEGRPMGWDDMDCISMAQDRDSRRSLMNAVMNLRVP